MTANLIYRSVLKNEIQEFITMKQNLGFTYLTESRALRRIDSFFYENNLTKKEISKELSNKWCDRRSHESENNHQKRVSIMRIFSTYLNDIGIPAYIPPKGVFRKPPKYEAHIYTNCELSNFFKAVDQSQSVQSECPYRHLVMPIFFRILYTSGLRVSELRLARIKDFNFSEGYLVVRNGKNHRSRNVPIHPELIKRCLVLINMIHQKSTDEEYLFMIRPGKPMTLQNVYHNFRRYLDKAHISHTGNGPRVHDFRHTYCVNILKKWVYEEKDLLCYTPYLKTMLGHESFEETAYYLKLTAELFPELRVKLETNYPNIIEGVERNDKEFY